MNENWKKKGITVILSISILLLLGTGIGAAETEPEVAAETAAATDYGPYLQSMIEYLNQHASEEFSSEKLAEDAMRGLFNDLDRFTFFIDPANVSALTGTFGGIGVSTSLVGDYVMISSIMPASPAELAGVLAGDRVISVDGENVVGKYSHEEITAMMRGEPGSTCTLEVMRNDGRNRVIEIVRAEIDIVPLNYEIRDDIIHIIINTFNSHTGDYFRQALTAAKQAGVNQIILDLRNNPGGEVDAMLQVAAEIIPKGLVFSTEYRYEGYPQEEFFSPLTDPQYEVVVLVNEHSASCSEILAAAVQDRQAGLVVGTRTFGKYDLQIVIPILKPEASRRFEELTGEWIINAAELYDYGFIPQGNDVMGWLTLNSGWWLRPNGERISREGLIPDIFVENPTDLAYANLSSSLEILTKNTKTGMGEESIDVYNAKKILNAAGYQIEQLNMLMDEQTFAAIQQFQSDHGLYPYGVLDFSTQDALNRLRLELIMNMDQQYAAAVKALTD